MFCRATHHRANLRKEELLDLRNIVSAVGASAVGAWRLGDTASVHAASSPCFLRLARATNTSLLKFMH